MNNNDNNNNNNSNKNRVMASIGKMLVILLVWFLQILLLFSICLQSLFTPS